MSFLFLKKKSFYIVVVILIGTGVLFISTRDDGEYDFETETVGTQTVTSIVTETGVVESDAEAELGFEISGRVASLGVREGDHVTRGDVIATLDDSSLYADLLSARARVDVEDAKLRELASVTGEGDSVEFQNLLAQQNRAVENAYRDLLSTDLVAVPALEFGVNTAPTISGTYNSTEEGDYIVDVFSSNTQSGASFVLSGLESGSGPATQSAPTSLGTRGLFIQFPTGTIESNKRWIISVPNKRSSTYTTRLNAYEAAVRTRDLTLSQKETTSYDIAIQEAQISQARAALSRAQVAYDNATLTAPFTGVVSEIFITEGETVSALSPVAVLVSHASYEIEVHVPEDDIRNIEVGDAADITFDAYPGDVFGASVTFVAPTAVEIDGVKVFKTILEFKEQDARIKAGLSVDIDIIAAEKAGVLAIPTRSVVSQDGKEYVRIFENGEFFLKPITTGLQGSSGYIEVIDGLSIGEEIVTFISEDTLEKLEEE